MRTFITSIVVFFFCSHPLTDSFAATPPVAHFTNKPPESIYSLIASMKVKDVQKKLGRKLTLKEKIGFLFLKKQMKKKAEEESKQGKSAFAMGLASIGLLAFALFLWPPLLVGAIITSILAIVFGTMATKDNPKDKKGVAGKIIGWIVLGLIVILVVAVIAAFASIFN